MAPLRPPRQHWADYVAAILPSYWDGAVSIYLPDTGPVTEYDAVNDTGGDAAGIGTLLIENRKADVNPIRAVRDVPTSGQWRTKQQVRVMIERQDGDPEIPVGAIVKVIDGGREPHLTGKTVIVQQSIGGSFSAVVTIEGITEFDATAPRVAP